MNIIRAYIFGFGKWENVSIDFVNDSNQFVVVSGENESGKSTLRQFILFMLFGYPPKKRLFYQPKMGGRMGGRLTVRTKTHGEFTIERIHDRNNGEATCIDDAGNTYDESWLKTCLSGIDQQTFEAIFSFDSNDLTKLHHVKEKELGDMLLGIGMTGTDKLYTVEKLLDKKLDHLFKVQGRKPKLNQQLNQLENRNKQLSELEQKEKSYRDKRQMEQQYEEEITNIKEKLDNISKQKSLLERRIQANPSMQQYFQKRMELDDLPKVNDFPEQGMERYQQLKEQLFPLESEKAVIEDNYRKYTEEKLAIQEQLLPETKYQLIKNKLNEINDYKQYESEYKFIIKNQQKIENSIQQQLSKLNIPLQLEDLQSISLPFGIEEKWAIIKQEMEQVSLEKQNINNEIASINEQLIYLSKEQKQYEQQLLPTDKYQEMNQQIADKKQYEQQQVIAQTEQKERQVFQKTWDKRKRFSNLTLTFCLFFSFIFFAIGTFTTTTFYWVGSAVLVGGIGQWLWVAFTFRQMTVLLESQRVHVKKTIISDAALKELEKQLEHQENLINKVNLIKEQQQHLRMELLKAQERDKFFSEKLIQVDQQVKEQVMEYPFLERVEVSYWPKLYQLLDTLLMEYQKYLQYQTDLNELHKKMDVIKQSMKQISEELNLHDKDDFAENVNNLKQMVDNKEKAQNKIDQYDDWLGQIEEQLRMIRQKMKPFQIEIKQLFETAQVNDEEGFLRLGKLGQARQQLTTEMKQIYYQMKALFKQEELEILLNNDLIDKQELDVQYEDMLNKEAKWYDSLEEKRQALADVKSVIATMETSEDYTIIKHEYQLELDEVNREAKQWAVYQFAKKMIEKTKSVYQQKYLPSLMERTAEYFRKLTNEKYLGVFPPTDDTAIQVEDKDGIRFVVSELSQGTRDQLYVALRFALSEIISKDYKFPFLVDDAFVHFDQKRVNVMYDILRETAKDQQVIFFTCQEMSGLVTDKRIQLGSFASKE